MKLITKSGDVYYYVYDPTADSPAVVYEAVGTTAFMNTREPSGALISREKYVSGVYQYSRTYHFDGLGNTIALTDENGATTDTYSYDAWGNVISHTDPDTEDNVGLTTDNPYQYVGELGYYTHYQEPTLNLLQLGVRYYDPSTGRFTQKDPMLQDQASPYAYAIPNPVVYNDPTGLSPKINCKGDDQKRRVRAALDSICNDIKKCDPFTTGPKQRQALRDFCNNGEVQCGSRQCVKEQPYTCGYYNAPKSIIGHPGAGPKKIVICLSGFTSPCASGPGINPETSVLLHEMFHYAGSGDGGPKGTDTWGENRRPVGGAQCRMMRCFNIFPTIIGDTVIYTDPYRRGGRGR